VIKHLPRKHEVLGCIPATTKERKEGRKGGREGRKEGRGEGRREGKREEGRKERRKKKGFFINEDSEHMWTFKSDSIWKLEKIIKYYGDQSSMPKVGAFWQRSRNSFKKGVGERETEMAIFSFLMLDFEN
jgi:hypothetical protein